jgi:type III restriction enzyme
MPYYGWARNNILDAIQPADVEGELPEKPIYERGRGPGSTSDVDFWTSKEVREVNRSHVNYVVADTRKWEQSAAYYLDTSHLVLSFAKNEGLGFAIKYQVDGETHDYEPDFLVRMQKDGKELGTLILETKGFDPKEGNKKGAAERWVKAVNYDGQYGRWAYRMTHEPSSVPFFLEEAVKEMEK